MSDPFIHLPKNQAAENNKNHILAALQQLGLSSQKVLEVGSGTGQHGIHFCQQLPELEWQPTEIEANIVNLFQWFGVAQSVGVTNFSQPQVFDIALSPLPYEGHDVVYSANVLHIVSPELGQILVKKVADALTTGQKFICYGPFKKEGQFTTQSNSDFNDWLQEQGYGGLLDLADITAWSEQRLVISHLENMPANNFLVVYEKQ